MGKEQATGRTAPRALRIFKWVCILLGAGLVLLFVGVVVLVIPDLFGRVPTPEAVLAVETFDRGERSRDANNTTTTTASHSRKINAHSPLPAGPLVPDQADLPATLRSQRAKLNDEFSSITRGVALLRQDLARLDYKKTDDLIQALFLADSRLGMRVYEAFPGARDPAKSERMKADSLYQAMREKIHDTAGILVGMDSENILRHERWDLCAKACEQGKWKQWPEAVYYWRRQGGWSGYWHIVSGAIYVRTRSIPILNPIRNLLPYERPPMVIGG